MKHDRWISKALTVASTSTMNQKHGAVILQGSRVLSVGVNTVRNVPGDNIPPKYLSVHAEMAALNNVESDRNLTLYVARLGKNGKQMNSAPCVLCLTELMLVPGLKRVVYTNDYEGWSVYPL